MLPPDASFPRRLTCLPPIHHPIHHPPACRETALLAHSCFDIGHFFATLFHCAVSVRGLGEAGDRPEARLAQEAWLAASVEQSWEAFWAVRRDKGPPVGLPSSAADERALLGDALGFAGCVLLRWSIGNFNIQVSPG